MHSHRAVWVLLAVGAVAGCGTDDDVTEAQPDDTGSDVTTVDTAMAETAVDDTGSPDTAVEDTFVADTFAADTFVADTFVADTFVADTFVADTFVADTFVADTADVGDVGCVVPGYGTVAGSIYYSRAGTTANEIWVAKGDGSSDTKLTDGAWPRVTSDSKYMVFHKDNLDPSRGNLYVRDLIAGTESKIANNSDYVVGLTFSADGSRIFFDRSCQISAANRDGTGEGPIRNTDCYDDCPDLRPSDSLIAFHNVHQGLWTMKSDGTLPAMIAGTLRDVWPRWSPSGSKLSFLHVDSESDPQGNLGVINADGTGRKVLTALTTPADGFRGGSGVWTADGTTLVAAGSVCATNGLWAIDATTGAIKRLHTSTTVTTTIDFVGEIR